jgi:putative CocE/NonD family hydrolase
LSVRVAFDVPAAMRDGVTLRADVYRPPGHGLWPVLLIRTPYGKGDLAETAWNGLPPVEAARQGFMVVIQDVRGRFASEGEWVPLAHEREDGADSVAWAAALPGANGRVAMWGGSYCGATQLLAALEDPPALAAIAPLMAWSEPLDGLLARGGAVELGLDLVWSLVAGFDWLERTAPPGERAARVAALLEDVDRIDDAGYWQLPVSDTAVMRAHGVPALDGMRAGQRPEVAARGRVAGAHDRVTVPSLHTGGWHDLFLQGTLDNYVALAEQGREARLIVGPWAHEQFSDPSGERC